MFGVQCGCGLTGLSSGWRCEVIRCHVMRCDAQGGSMHVDEAGSENYAAIYYANLHWLPQWLGHTHYLPGTLSHLQNDAGLLQGVGGIC